MKRTLLACLGVLVLSCFPLAAQPAHAHEREKDAELRFVVYLSRHGVRAPTGKASAYNAYSAAPWPAWPVQPAYLTPHGYRLMELFGAYDRLELSREGLFPNAGCIGSDRISIYADSDQRTRETGKALAAGLFPTCPPPVRSLPEGTNDPLFHRSPEAMKAVDPALAVAAIGGRIGNRPESLTEAYRHQITELDKVLSTCGATVPAKTDRASLFSVPATLGPGEGDHLADLRGPLPTASTISENLLLAYADGKPVSEVGWGCGDGAHIRSWIALHTAATDVTQRTPLIASAQASNLLDHIRRSLAQAVTRQPVAGARSRPTDRVLFLVGHDTNILNVAALLRVNWIADGRRDDTAPGGALAFELWQDRTTRSFEVRVVYTVQTLEQMREATPLSLAAPPERALLFLPACSRPDSSCSWSDFDAALRSVTDPRFVDAQ